SPTCRPGLSRWRGKLQLPAFAATPRGGWSWGRLFDSPAAWLRSRTPPTPSWITTTSLGPPGGVYRASLAGLVAEFGPAAAVGELSGPRLTGWFRDRYATAAPATWNRELAPPRAPGGWGRRGRWPRV